MARRKTDQLVSVDEALDRAVQYRSRIFARLRDLGYRTIRLQSDGIEYRLISPEGNEHLILVDCCAYQRRNLRGHRLDISKGVPLVVYAPGRGRWESGATWRSDDPAGWDDASVDRHVKRICRDLERGKED